MSTERLNKSSDRVRESRRTMLETEELGVSILHDLHQQRQSLLHANNTVFVDEQFFMCISEISVIVCLCLKQHCRTEMDESR